MICGVYIRRVSNNTRLLYKHFIEIIYREKKNTMQILNCKAHK